MEDINITIEETVVPISIIIDENPIGQTGPIGPIGNTPLLSAIGDSIDVSYDNGTTYEELVKFSSLSSGGGTEIYQSDTAPDPTLYPNWYNTSNGVLYIWQDTVWVNASHTQSSLRTISMLAYLGDSITNSCTGFTGVSGVVSYLWRGYASYAAAILGRPYIAAPNPRAMNGAPVSDMDFGWDGVTALTYATDISAINVFSVPANAYPGENRTMLQVLIDSGAKDCVVLIGTNDANTTSASTILTRLENIVVALRAAGIRVFLCTLLPRTGSGFIGAFQPIIDTVNLGLPQIAIDNNCILVPWHTALMTNGAQNTSYFYDSTHLNAAGACVAGQQLAAVLLPYSGDEFEVPANGDSRWLTTNAYCETDANTNGIADGFLPFFFTTPTYAIHTDADNVKWQRLTEASLDSTGIKYLYAPAIPALTITALKANQKKIRAVCRYEVISGEITGVTIISNLRNSGNTTIRTASYYGAFSAGDGILPTHGGLMITEEHTVPDETASIDLTFRFFGSGTVQLRQFGWIVEE